MEPNQEQCDKELRDAGLWEVAQRVQLPFGFKIESGPSGAYLRGMTADEYAKFMTDNHKKTLTDVEIYSPSCGYAGGWCYSSGCTQAGGKCLGPYSGGSGYWYCVCNY